MELPEVSRETVLKAMFAASKNPRVLLKQFFPEEAMRLIDRKAPIKVDSGILKDSDGNEYQCGSAIIRTRLKAGRRSLFIMIQIREEVGPELTKEVDAYSKDLVAREIAAGRATEDRPPEIWPATSRLGMAAVLQPGSAESHLSGRSSIDISELFK